jgi:hypothetical protein
MCVSVCVCVCSVLSLPLSSVICRGLGSGPRSCANTHAWAEKRTRVLSPDTIHQRPAQRAAFYARGPRPAQMPSICRYMMHAHRGRSGDTHAAESARREKADTLCSDAGACSLALWCAGARRCPLSMKAQERPSLRRDVREALAPGCMGPTIRRTTTVRGERMRHTGASTRAPFRLPQMVAVHTEQQQPSWVEAPCACPGKPLRTICRPKHSHSCNNAVRRCRSRWLPLVVSLLLLMAAKTDGSCPPGTTGSGEHPACNAPCLARFHEQTP